jgi:phytoene dehydrogenase-like protein
VHFKERMKKIVIIGGGIAGLSTGCYAQMHGFQSEIYEMHSSPGGVCTSWKRGEYLFDHCLHWVLGSNKGTNIYGVFKDLGISDAIQFYYPEIFRVICLNNKTLTVYTDIDKLEKELLDLFPDEKKGIKKYTHTLRKYTGFNPPMDGEFGDFGIKGFFSLFPFMPSFVKLKNISIENYLTGLFNNRELKEMLFRLFPVKKLPAIMAVMPLSYMHRKEGGYPLGGSLNFARTIEKKYIELNGRISYKSKVKNIIVENNCAAGIELDNGKIITGDIIISACDGRSILFDMLHGNYLTKRLRKLYRNPSLWPPIISISLGINRDFSRLPEIYDFKLKEPIVVAGEKKHWSGFFHYCHDSAIAPIGKSVIKTQIETNYSYWKNLYEKNRDEYNFEKMKVLEKYIAVLEERFPGIKEDIQATDIATPVTWERYTGNWQGSYEGWLPTVKIFGTILPKKLPRLQHFYMTGQWIFPGGGVPMCMVQGRNLIRMISHDYQ